MRPSRVISLPVLFLTLPWLLWAGGAAASRQAGEAISVPLFARRLPVGARLEAFWQWSDEGGPIRPIAIDLHPSGVLAGVEARRHRVFLIDDRGQAITFTQRGPGGGLEPGFPNRIFARSGLAVFALDPEERVVDQFDLRGAWEHRLDLEGAAAAAGEELYEIVDFCLDRAGDLFLLDAGEGRVLRFDRSGTLQRVLGMWGDWVPEAPVALEVDGKGVLYLLEARPPGLLVLDPDGRLLGHLPLRDEAGEPLNPSALAVDPWGNAFVADARTGAIRVVPAGGGAAWWLRGPGEARLQAADLAVDEAPRLLVADPQASGVWVFALDYQAKAASRGPRGKP